MPKFYVTSGDMKRVVMAKTAKDAVDKAIIDFVEKGDDENTDQYGTELGHIILVSERGFSGDNKGDLFFSTENVIRENGYAEAFGFPDKK